MTRDKTEVLHVRLTPAGMASLKARAERAHRTVSDYARLTLAGETEPATAPSTAAEPSTAAQARQAHAFTAQSGTLRCGTCGIPRGQHT